MQVLDESPRHGGPPGAETHFAVVVVSGRFAGLPPLQRHRLVHAALSAELAGPLHALAIVARTPHNLEMATGSSFHTGGGRKRFWGDLGFFCLFN
uniref:BolA-like protein 1 n=1 Tax=Calidris pygmaea TaxID=425635 RepID=A0A8C3PIJ6_9CHAR